MADISRELERLYLWLPELVFEESQAFLTLLVHDPVFVATQILPTLAHLSTGREPIIAASYGERETSPCAQVFLWPAGATTAIHDHTGWGAYHAVVGSLLEERYTRLDDGSQPSRALVRKIWQRTWRHQDGASTVGAYEAGIHRISNPSSRLAISVHVYGPRVGLFDGRDYDPGHDFVCDRLEVDDVVIHPGQWRTNRALLR